MRRERRAQMLAGTNADLAAVAEELESIFARPGVCVLAPRAELGRCALDEISTL